jgi:hypothetical protein
VQGELHQLALLLRANDARAARIAPALCGLLEQLGHAAPAAELRRHAALYDFDRALAVVESLLPPGGATDAEGPGGARSAAIAELATDAAQGLSLFAATGNPQRIVVLVKDAWGGTRLAVGYVYSWCEFPSRRLWTDAEWAQDVDAGGATLKANAPEWYGDF